MKKKLLITAVIPLICLININAYVQITTINGIEYTFLTPCGGDEAFSAPWQWQSSTNGTTWSNIQGANSDYYQVDLAQATHSLKYRLIATNPVHGCLVYSNEIWLSVNFSIAFSVPKFCYGTYVNLYDYYSTSGGTTSVVISFQELDESTGNWVSLSPSQVASYLPSEKKIKLDGSSYDGQSASIQITVSNYDILQGVMNSSDQNICYNTAPALLNSSVTGGNNGSYTYGWQSSTDRTNWSDIPSSNSLTYQPPDITQTTYFRLKVTNCGIAYSNAVKINVYGNLTAGAVTENQTICYNSLPTQLTGSSASGGTGSYTYQWQYSPDNSSWQSISNANSLAYSPPALTQTTYYRLAVTSGQCGTVYSNSVKITVYNNLTAGTAGSNQTICYNTKPASLSCASPSGGSGTYTYNWQKSLNNLDWSNITDASNLSYSPSNLTQTTYYRLAVSSGKCNTVTSNTIVVNVYGNLAAGTIMNGQNICYITIPSILTGTSPTGGTGSYTYQWQSSTDSLTWSSIPNVSNLTYQPPALTQTTYYRLAVSSGTCGTVNSNVLSVLVYNQNNPGTLGNNQTICYNTAPLTLTGSAPSGSTGLYSYQWQYSQDSSTWYSIPGANNSDFAPSSLIKNTFYRRIVNFDICGLDTTNVLKINVLKDLVAGKIASDQNICYNTTPNLLTGTSPTGGTGSYTYQWQKSLNNKDWDNVVNGSTSYFQPESLSKTTYYRRKDMSGTCGIVNTNQVLINVRSEISAGTISSNQTILFNSLPAQIIGTYPSGGTGTYTYQWQKSLNNLDWSNIADNSNELSYQPLNLKKTTYYRRIDNFGVCGVDTTNWVCIAIINNLYSGVISSDQNICYNTKPELLFGTSPSGGSGSYTYQWQSSTNDSVWKNVDRNGQSSAYQPDSLKETTYFRRLLVDKDPDAGFVPSNSVLISLYPKIEQPLTDELALYCSKTNISINIKNPLSTLSYTWYNNSKTISKGTKVTLSNVTDIMTLSLVASDINCSSAAKSISIKIDKIKADFDVSKANAVVDEEIRYINASSNAVTYKWNFFDGTNSIEQEPFHKYNTTGTKDVQLKVGSVNGCTDSITKYKVLTILNSTDIKNVKNTGFLIYPIPVRDVLNIDLEENKEIFDVEIFDFHGNKIIQKYGKGKLKVDFDEYPNGAYLVKIKSLNLNQSVKIIKSN